MQAVTLDSRRLQPITILKEYELVLQYETIYVKDTVLELFGGIADAFASIALTPELNLLLLEIPTILKSCISTPEQRQTETSSSTNTRFK